MLCLSCHISRVFLGGSRSPLVYSPDNVVNSFCGTACVFLLENLSCGKCVQLMVLLWIRVSVSLADH